MQRLEKSVEGREHKEKSGRWSEYQDCKHQMLLLAKALSKSLDEKYQDFFKFKGHHEFGV